LPSRLRCGCRCLRSGLARAQRYQNAPCRGVTAAGVDACVGAYGNFLRCPACGGATTRGSCRPVIGESVAHRGGGRHLPASWRPAWHAPPDRLHQLRGRRHTRPLALFLPSKFLPLSPPRAPHAGWGPGARGPGTLGRAAADGARPSRPPAVPPGLPHARAGRPGLAGPVVAGRRWAAAGRCPG